MKRLKIKETYLLLLIVVGLVSLSLYTTYALFIANTEITDVVSFSTNLTTNSSILEYEMVTIPAGESKVVELNVTNSHTSSIYYGVWYQNLTGVTDMNIGVYTEKNSTPASGTTDAGSSKTILIGIANNDSNDLILNLGVVGSETSNLNLSSNRTLITGQYVTAIIVTEEYLNEHTTTTTETVNLEYTTPKMTEVTLTPGTYKLEVWGAQGGYRSSATYGGKGGYSYGTLTLTDSVKAYVYVGGSGNTGGTAGGFNGGGKRGKYNGGGGASDIRLGTDSLYARVIVAGGGGSDGASSKTGMYGGGTQGGATTANYGTGGFAGTQTGVSSSSWKTTTQSTSTTTQAGAYAGFGFGGNGITRSSGYGGAGGGGWYGGSGSYPDGSGDDDRGGGGGSGYVYTSSTYSNYPSGCLLNSNYYLTDAATVAGNTSFTDFSGSTVTGHSGDGAVRISGTREATAYTIPVIFGLTDMTIELGTNISLSNNVTYICENGGESCEYVGPDNIDTSTLSEGTYQINYRIVDSNNTIYIYQRILNVIKTTGTLVSNEYLNEHSTSTTTPGTEQITPINYTESGSYTVSLTSGVYTLEVWGARGGYGQNRSAYGGAGGYAKGTLTLSSTTTLYVYVGGMGKDAYECEDSDYGSRTSSGGFNGGGDSKSYCAGTNTSSYCGAGGGASDIRIGTDSLYARVIVAGGGGGGKDRLPGGAGGGTSGEAGKLKNDDGTSISSAANTGKGGTQTAGGASYYGSTIDTTGKYGRIASFGNGAGVSSSGTGDRIAGGGGGWYGGGYGYESNGGAGGGSGYVYTASTASNYPSGCLLDSSYYLTNTSMSTGQKSGDGEAKISGIKNIQITTITYHIPRVLNLTNVSISKGQTYDLTTGVTYECENGTTSCTYLGPSITDTSILDTGTHKIKYSINSADNTVYIYERTLTVN